MPQLRIELVPFYFGELNPERAEMVLRWAASVIIHEKSVSTFWGNMDPNKNMREWMLETMKVFRNHHTGIGKYVSHFGTTRMGFKSAANAMYQGQGKQLNVDRHHESKGLTVGSLIITSSPLIMATECIQTIHEDVVYHRRDYRHHWTQ